MTVQAFDTGHEDLIHDVAYDFYGKRLATCSSDQRLKVWEYVDETGSWEPVDTWKAHEGSIFKVTWALPEFGKMIASCSFDRSVRIWEEQEHESKNTGRRFNEKARLVDSRGSVQDIEFAPNSVSLKLATCAADGMVRIYEALDVNNLAHWTLMEEFEIGPGANTREADGNYCISWCPSRLAASMIVVGCGKDNCAKVFRQDSQNKWAGVEVLDGHEDVVHDVSWAPQMGRSYHLIATASKDGHVRIFKLTPERAGFYLEKAADLTDHEAEVWKVEWNVTGTILSSSGDDGKVRLWKASVDGKWQCMSIIHHDKPSEDMES